MSETANGAAAPDDTLVSISKADLALLVRAADMLSTYHNDDALNLDDLASWKLAQTREPTDLERSLDPEIDEIVEISDDLWNAMSRAADLTGLDLSLLGMEDEDAEPEMAEA